MIDAAAPAPTAREAARALGLALLPPLFRALTHAHDAVRGLVASLIQGLLTSSWTPADALAPAALPPGPTLAPLAPLPSLHAPGWAAGLVAALVHAAGAAFSHSELIGRTAERGLGGGGGEGGGEGESKQAQLASVRAAKAACESALRLLENAPALPTACTTPYALPLLPFVLLAQRHTDLLVAGLARTVLTGLSHRYAITRVTAADVAADVGPAAAALALVAAHAPAASASADAPPPAPPASGSDAIISAIVEAAAAPAGGAAAAAAAAEGTPEAEAAAVAAPEAALTGGGGGEQGGPGVAWHRRRGALAFLVAFRARGLHALTPVQDAALLAAAERALLDPQLQVQQAATAAVSGFTAMMGREAHAVALRKYSRLAATPLPPKVAPPAAAAAASAAELAAWDTYRTKRAAGALERCGGRGV